MAQSGRSQTNNCLKTNWEKRELNCQSGFLNNAESGSPVLGLHTSTAKGLSSISDLDAKMTQATGQKKNQKNTQIQGIVDATCFNLIGMQSLSTHRNRIFGDTLFNLYHVKLTLDCF